MMKNDISCSAGRYCDGCPPWSCQSSGLPCNATWRVDIAAVDCWRAASKPIELSSPKKLRNLSKILEHQGDHASDMVSVIDQDGTVSRGAAAVFRSLGTERAGRALIWCYEHVPGFAPVTETAYRFIARNRGLASGHHFKVVQTPSPEHNVPGLPAPFAG